MARVLEVHTFELKPTTDEKTFQEYVIQEVLPIYRKVPGQSADLLKGERGERAGKYMLLVEVESVERRDQINPPEGQDSLPAEIQALVGNVDAIWDRFFAFVEPDTSYTSYVILGDKIIQT